MLTFEEFLNISLIELLEKVSISIEDTKWENQ